MKTFGPIIQFKCFITLNVTMLQLHLKKGFSDADVRLFINFTPEFSVSQL